MGVKMKLLKLGTIPIIIFTLFIIIGCNFSISVAESYPVQVRAKEVVILE